MVTAIDSQVGGISTIVDLTLSLDTSAYADGDLMADVQEMTDATRSVIGTGVIQTLTVIDKDDNGGAFDVYLTSDATSWGTENDAVAITDALAASIQGSITVEASNYYDLGGAQVAHINSIGMVIESPSNSTSVYVATIARGTNTYTASGVVLRFGLFVD